MLQIKSHWDEGTNAPRPNLAFISWGASALSLSCVHNTWGQREGLEQEDGPSTSSKNQFRASLSYIVRLLSF